jgi:hypothetical protein
LDEADQAWIGRTAAKLLPKSAFSDGTAAKEMHRICGELGLAELWVSRQQVPVRERRAGNIGVSMTSPTKERILVDDDAASRYAKACVLRKQATA